MSEDLLNLLGSNAIIILSVLGYIRYIGKKRFETYLERKGQKFKSNLDQNLKDFDPQLRNAFHKFSSLHNEQSLTIKKLYRLIVQLEFSAAGYLNHKGEESKLAQDLNELNIYYHTTELFFSDEIKNHQ